MTQEKYKCLECGIELEDDDILVVKNRDSEGLIIEILDKCPKCGSIDSFEEIEGQ